MLNDPLANALSAILNYEKVGKKEFTVNPSSKVINKVLQIMNEKGYLGAAESITESKGGFSKVNLIGAINKCGVIKPRFSVGLADFEKFEKRHLPGKGVGIIIISTSQGIMTLDEAKEKKIGGRLIAYCY